MVVYGHTPVPEPEWLNRTIYIDTGCVFGGKLTALRYPENASWSRSRPRATYCEPARPFLPPKRRRPALTAQQAHDDLLDIEDVLGKRIVATRLRGNVTIREENATAALEVMSRFAADPKWLIYLPPTMSPSRDHAREPGLLEHPAEAFAYFRSQGVAAGGLRGEAHGLARGRRRLPRRGGRARALRRRRRRARASCYTRTGRRFFDDAALESGAARPACASALDARRTLGASSRPTGCASTAS